MSISDRVVVMEAGRITQVDNPYNLYEHPGTPFISDFVGKANRLRGVPGPGGQPQVAAQGPLSLSLRPEKITFGAAGSGKLDGRISCRYFLGSQWLYRVDTALGNLAVVRANDGNTPLDEGTQVGLDWNDALLRVLNAGEVAA